MSSAPPIVLSFAASDPTGGAGIQADLLTIASLGCHPLSVLTALTAQDTRGVYGLMTVEPEWIARQARRLARAEPEAALADCARELTRAGCSYVLITGTHEPGAEVLNTLYDARGVVREDRWQRLPGSYHGSGCTLASALAAFLAKGLSVPEAARAAQEYTWKTLEGGFALGRGQKIPDRFFKPK